MRLAASGRLYARALGAYTLYHAYDIRTDSTYEESTENVHSRPSNL